MNNEALDSLRSQVNTTYCIVTRTYDAAGNMTGESRAEHPEPYIKLTHDQGVEVLRCLDSYSITVEDAIDFLRNDGWLPKHDKALMERLQAKPIKRRLDQVYGVIGGDCPNCRNWVQSCHSFCGFCGQAVEWGD